MKKIMIMIISIIMILSMYNCAYAEQPANILISSNTIKVQNNGKYIDFTDQAGNKVEPQIMNDRTMVPFRKIFNALGVMDDNIVWDSETKTVAAKKEEVEITLQIDNPIAKKTMSGETTEIKLDSAPVIVEGRTLVPVRFIAESMNQKVGWDELHKTVIIIDIEGMVDDLEKAIPNYMKIINMPIETPETYATQVTLSGKVDYKDKENKANNGTLNLNGNVSMKKLKEAISLDLLLKLTGKGEIYDVVKEAKLTKIDADMMMNENTLYFKSSLLERVSEKYIGKWVKMEDESLAEIFALLQGEKDNVSLRDAFMVEESQMTIDTYQSLETMVMILKTLLEDENVSISEKKGNITCTITIDFEDVTAFFKEMQVETALEGFSGKIITTNTFKNNVAQSSSMEIDMKYQEESEMLSLTIKAEGKNSTASGKIQLPKDSQTVPYSE